MKTRLSFKNLAEDVSEQEDCRNFNERYKALHEGYQLLGPYFDQAAIPTQSFASFFYAAVGQN